MATLLKHTRRAIRQRTTKARQAVVENAPAWARTRFGRPAAYLELMLADHGVFRFLYLNRHRLAKDAWRAAQPAPQDIRRFARDGVRTIINLRGPRDCSSYNLEKAACDRHGIFLVNYQVRSRAAPTVAEIKGAQALFEQVEYPILMHCKSGADRAGLMSALWLTFMIFTVQVFIAMPGAYLVMLSWQRNVLLIHSADFWKPLNVEEDQEIT